MTHDIDPDFKIADAIAYGWDGGKARALVALRPYVRHIARLQRRTTPNAVPRDERCSCGLRQVWRIRETAE
jgi:hypothetical protein